METWVSLVRIGYIAAIQHQEAWLISLREDRTVENPKDIFIRIEALREAPCKKDKHDSVDQT